MIRNLILEELHYVEKKLFSNLFDIIFPLITYIFVIPELSRVSDLKLDMPTSVLFMGLLMQLSAVFVGKSFSSKLLVDKDNLVLKSLLITPAGTDLYILIKLIVCYLHAFLDTMIFLLVANNFSPDIYILQTLSLSNIILMSFMVAFIAPVFGFLIYIISKSKVDGNSISAIGIILVILPTVLLLDTFANNMQYIFAILPNFGVSKYILIEMVGFTIKADLVPWQYIVLSFITNFVFIIFMYIVAIKKTKKA